MHVACKKSGSVDAAIPAYLFTLVSKIVLKKDFFVDSTNNSLHSLKKPHINILTSMFRKLFLFARLE